MPNPKQDFFEELYSEPNFEKKCLPNLVPDPRQRLSLMSARILFL